MPEKLSPDVGHEVLEADIARLATEIQKHREKPEMKGLSEKEILTRSLQAFEATPPSPPSSGPLPEYARASSAGTKLEIEYLLDMAFHKGITQAAKEARKSNPFVFDAFHDALVGRLYPELKKRGILK